MKKIHNHLLRKSKVYRDWHDHPNHPHVHWGAMLVVAIIVGFLVLQGVNRWKVVFVDWVLIDFNPRSATLSFDPKTRELAMGETFGANIILDTGGKPVDGVDLYSVHYDPTILSVVDAMPNVEGVQIQPGSVLGVNVVNSVDQSTGTIKFSQASSGGTNFTGKGVLATLQFKAIGKGSTYLKFDFHFGSTKDTNVAHAGRDQLDYIVDALYTVK